MSMWYGEDGNLSSLPFGYFDAPEGYELPDEPHTFGMWYYGKSGSIVSGSTDLTRKRYWANGKMDFCRCGNNFKDVSERFDISVCSYSSTEPPVDPCEGAPIFNPNRPTVLWPRCMNIAVCFKPSNIQSPTPCPYMFPLIYDSDYIFRVPSDALPSAIEYINVDISNGGLFNQIRYNVRLLQASGWVNLSITRSLNPSAGIPPAPTTIWCYYGVSASVNNVDLSLCATRGALQMGLIVQPNAGTPCALQCF